MKSILHIETNAKFSPALKIVITVRNSMERLKPKPKEQRF